MQDALGIVIFVVVGVGVVVAIVTLFGRSRLYDDIGRGSMSFDREDPPSSRAERDDEIRQMLEARNALRAAHGRETVDVEAELAELTRLAAAHDPEIVDEVRSLVRARNSRRIARGQEPLDEETEIARQLRDLPG